MTRNEYLEQFEAHANAYLGGLDMAGEFFAMHPDIKAGMVAVATMHMLKGGGPQRAAGVWFQRTLRPQLRRDRKASVGK
jgi:hypothetical protein